MFGRKQYFLLPENLNDLYSDFGYNQKYRNYIVLKFRKSFFRAIGTDSLLSTGMVQEKYVEILVVS